MNKPTTDRSQLVAAFASAFLSTGFATWGAVSLGAGFLLQGILAGMGAAFFIVIQNIKFRQLSKILPTLRTRAVLLFFVSLAILPVISGLTTYSRLLSVNVPRDVGRAIVNDGGDPIEAVIGSILAMPAHGLFAMYMSMIAAAVTFICIGASGALWFYLRRRGDV